MTELTDERRQDLIDAAIAAAQLNGCNCNPDVEPHEVAPNVFAASVAHDDWCALMRAN